MIFTQPTTTRLLIMPFQTLFNMAKKNGQNYLMPKLIFPQNLPKKSIKIFFSSRNIYFNEQHVSLLQINLILTDNKIIYVLSLILFGD